MKTIILPGYSPHNKDWAQDLKSELNLGHDVVVHNWEHWGKGGSISVKKEIARILKEAGGEETNIIAKSMGTFIAAKLIPQLKGRIKKVILCGIPSTSQFRGEIYKEVFADFSSKNLIVFQNERDPFATYEEVKKFMTKVNPRVLVVKKERNDHHYPYPEEIGKFLSED